MDSIRKEKAVVFYTYLPPWRIDVFNEMATLYDLTIVFLSADSEGFTYNRELLLSKLKAKAIFLNNGFFIGNRPVRFGIFKIIKVIKPDVVFSHEFSPTSILLSLGLKMGFVKFKYIITTSDNLAIASNTKGFRNSARKFVLKYANGIIVYSSSVMNWYEKNFPELKIRVCPNIQNPSSLLSYKSSFNRIVNEYKIKFNIGDEKIILYTGRLVSQKGIDLLLNAFSKSNNDNYKLIIVGEGEEKQRLLKLADDISILSKVVFAGYYDEAELYAWYSFANFFILPSIYEPFGAVVNESLVFGCPVMASKYIGALDFIKPGINGQIFDPLNEESFIESINRAMIEYANFNEERKDLMFHSFNDYVKVFKSIII